MYCPVWLLAQIVWSCSANLAGPATLAGHIPLPYPLPSSPIQGHQRHGACPRRDSRYFLRPLRDGRSRLPFVGQPCTRVKEQHDKYCHALGARNPCPFVNLHLCLSFSREKPWFPAPGIIVIVVHRPLHAFHRSEEEYRALSAGCTRCSRKSYAGGIQNRWPKQVSLFRRTLKKRERDVEVRSTFPLAPIFRPVPTTLARRVSQIPDMHTRGLLAVH